MILGWAGSILDNNKITLTNKHLSNILAYTLLSMTIFKYFSIRVDFASRYYFLYSNSNQLQEKLVLGSGQ